MLPGLLHTLKQRRSRPYCRTLRFIPMLVRGAQCAADLLDKLPCVAKDVVHGYADKRWIIHPFEKFCLVKPVPYSNILVAGLSSFYAFVTPEGIVVLADAM